MNDIRNARGERKYYAGFGAYKTASGWAKALGLPRMTVWTYLQQGLTPEQIVEKRGVTAVDLKSAKRKERVGIRQTETLERMESLLDFSDYDPDGLEVNLIGGAYRHQIVWNGLIIGAYDPSKDILWLTGGDKLKLRNPLVPDQKIYHTGGKWCPTPETKRAIFASSGKPGLR